VLSYSRGWRGLTMTADGLRLLQDLRRSMLDPPRQLRPHTVTVTQDDSRPEMSAPSPNVTMKRNRARPFTPDSGRHRESRCSASDEAEFLVSGGSALNLRPGVQR